MKASKRTPLSPLWWVMLMACLFICSLFAFEVLKSWNKLESEATKVRLTDLELREREERAWGRFLLPYIEDLKKRALHPPTDDGLREKLRDSVYGLDPYSKFIPDAKNPKGGIAPAPLVPTHGGVGIDIVAVNDGARILDVHLRGGAERVGLMIGDVITHVILGKQRIALAGLSREEQMEKLEGALGSPVSLVVMRHGKQRLFGKIYRMYVAKSTVWKVQHLAPHYGYVALRAFKSGDTETGLAYAIGLLKSKGALHGLVIDLTGNLGGEFSAAVEVARLFLNGGLITTTYSRTEGKKEYFALPGGDILHGIPIVLLVDKYSASASELVIGALVDRDLPRAVIIGEHTYEKGVGQTTVPIAGGSAKVTAFEFFTPRGNAVEKKGFTPDPALLELYQNTDPECLGAWRCAALNYLIARHNENELNKKK